MKPGVGGAVISGRVSERARLVRLIHDAFEGDPGAVMIHGEAGVGKTALVRSVTDQVGRDGAQVLWGNGLRFDSADALYLPITMAFDRWSRDADPAVRESVLTSVSGVHTVLPSISDRIADARTRPTVVVEALLNHILKAGPVVLVIDDVHWADPASLGVLAYLIAGFSNQRLALVTMFRDEDWNTADQFPTWLADMRRMSSVEVVALDRLDKEATRGQLVSLIGDNGAERFLDPVFSRSQGNAYLTELLVSEINVHADELPESPPAALAEALLAAWQRLTPSARAATRILAVAGRPTEVPALQGVVAALGTSKAFTPALHEAVGAGILIREGETIWFRHPLLADVLMSAFLPGEAAPIHAAWARVLSRTSAAGIDEVRRQSSLALHSEAAGDARGAFVASVEAANLAEDHRALGDAARNLVRAARLWNEGAPDPGNTTTLLALLERAEQMCRRADQGTEAHVLVVQALTIVDEEVDPLTASRLLADWADLEWELGRGDNPPIEAVAHAVELAASAPASEEYAETLAMLGNGLRWTGRHDEAATRAEQAVAAAHRSGSPRALSQALNSRASTRAQLPLADAETQQALNHAHESGDDLAISHAYGARARVLARMGSHRELALVMHQALDHALAHGRGSFESAVLAGSLILLGDLRGATDVLREGLSLAGMTTATVRLRLQAAVVASRRGKAHLAIMHRSRAYELIPTLERRLSAEAATALAEIQLATSAPSAALELALAAMPSVGADPNALDELLVLGTRAAADLTEVGEDLRDSAITFRAREDLATLISMRNNAPTTPFQPTCTTDLVHPAMGALFEAEWRRATGASETHDAWRRAASLCRQAGMRWDEHQALWRLGAELVRDLGGVPEAAEALRAAGRYAIEQEANALLDRVHEAAGLGRIPLIEALPPKPRAIRPAAFDKLTEREAEVLSHLVANRTNAEIGAQLFISAKTVSVHVSNLLRKTSTNSRREVAALATRLGWGSTNPSDDP